MPNPARSISAALIALALSAPGLALADPPLNKDALLQRAYEGVRAAERGGRDAMDRYADAAGAFMEVWSRFDRADCEAKRPGCARAEEVLYNAARGYQAARDIQRSIEVRRLLTDPRYNLHQTELAKRAVYEIGLLYQSIAEYEEAAAWYERFARESPGMAKAPEALSDAVVLRLGLLQINEAIKDAEAYEKAYGAKNAPMAAKIQTAIASSLLEASDPRGAEQRLNATMGEIERHGTLDVKVSAHNVRGRARLALGKKKEAREDFATVRGLTEAGAIEALVKRAGDDPWLLRTLGRTLEARGHALFFFAEERRRELSAAKRPLYKGSGAPDDARRFIEGPLASFYEGQRKAAAEIERAYLAVLDIQPMPPPRWVAAASAGVGLMYSKLAADLMITQPPSAWRRPAPPAWGKTSEALLAEWREALEKASDPDRKRAKAAMVRCVSFAAKYQVSTDHSQRCTAWLTSHYPAEYPKLDEIAGAPERAFAPVPWAPLPDPR